MTSGSQDSYELSNEELLCRCGRGDQTALSELFRRHERPVYSVLLRMLDSHEDTEEALAEVFVKIWRSADRFKGESKFTTWMYRIAGNTAFDILRSRKNRREITIDDAVLSEVDFGNGFTVDPEEVMIRSHELSEIDKAIQMLSAEDRLIVTLYHIREYSLEEVAEIIGQNKANLKVKLFRARQKLRGFLGNLEGATKKDEMQPGTTKSVGL